MVDRYRCSFFRATAASAILLLAAAAAGAGSGFEDKDLTLRLPAAFSRFATYADVAAVGGASAGSKWSSSVNPASIDWQPIPTDLHFAASPQYSNLHFRDGLDLNLVAEAMTFNVGDAGTFQPALAQVRTNQATTPDGIDFGLNTDLAMFQWGKRFGDTALGAGFTYSKSTSSQDIHSTDTRMAASYSESYDWRIGVLHSFADHLVGKADHLLGGAVLDYAFSRDRNTVYDFMGLGIGNTHFMDDTQQFIFRPGVSYEYLPDSTIYVDYQLATFTNSTGRLQVNRFLMGVDHSLAKWLFVRAGTAMDTRGNLSWTTGLGIYPCDRFSIDLAYQDNMFPELTPEFGRSRTLTISLGISF
jgi:hypothetical protein